MYAAEGYHKLILSLSRNSAVVVTKRVYYVRGTYVFVEYKFPCRTDRNRIYLSIRTTITTITSAAGQITGRLYNTPNNLLF